jgi:hypothetical protein
MPSTAAAKDQWAGLLSVGTITRPERCRRGLPRLFAALRTYSGNDGGSGG